MEFTRHNHNFQLNEGWKLAIDPDNIGVKERWYDSAPVPNAELAPVPGIIQQVFPDYHGLAWYWTTFMPALFNGENSRYLLKFGAVDYLAKVWLNGSFLGEHEGGETPFEFDVSDVVRLEAANQLVVRVLNPKKEPIDGIVLKETPHCNKIVNEDFFPGVSYNNGGIITPVELIEVSSLRIDKLVVKPTLATGEVELILTLINAGLVSVSVTLDILVRPVRSGHTLIMEQASLEAPTGASEHVFKFSVDKPHAWSVSDPFLYQVQVLGHLVGQACAALFEQSVKFGFRYFEVKQGFFYLNGKRIFVRSTHTINHYPLGIQVPHDREYLFKDLIYAKACGFNMVRFIASAAYPEQLDYCDEIGLMVYTESHASWELSDSPQMGERYDRSTLEVIVRDRNHPSVVIWGLLNETFDGPVFRHAHGFLGKLREQDETRLVLLSSGRWDDQASIGSISNPFSPVWEHAWGNENPGEEEEPHRPGWYDGILGHIQEVGDAHMYPYLPTTAAVDHLIRTLGHGARPVYLSEYGIGSLQDVIHCTRMFEQIGADEKLLDYSLFRSMTESFLADWHKYGMSSVYPFPDDFFRESQLFSAIQRRIAFDLIRSNPQICGYNVTGMLDHVMTGEGLWTFFREFKPTMVDTLTDGFHPLRWCLFVSRLHGYSGDTFKIEAVLANEDMLLPGSYSVMLRICSEESLIWEKHVEFVIPEKVEGGEAPFAITVFCEDIAISGATGKYQLGASLEKGGAPAGDRKDFFITDAADFPQANGQIVLWGIDEKVEKWLAAQGLQTVSFESSQNTDRADGEVVLVGRLEEAETTSAKWNELLSRIANGSKAIFLDSAVFKAGEQSMQMFPLENKGRCYEFLDYLYHKECVSNGHPIFAGIAKKGIMDWRIFGDVTPRMLFEGQDLSTDVAAAAFTTGYTVKGGCLSGMIFAGYPSGQGHFYINTLRILENLTQNPTADRLLLNMISYAGGR